VNANIVNILKQCLRYTKIMRRFLWMFALGGSLVKSC